MMGNSAKREDVPESLFTVDDEVDDPKTAVHPKKVPPPPESEPSPEFEALISEVSKKVERRKTKTKSKTIAASSFERSLVETREMIDSGDWANCGARHLVALYCLMHKKCYGVEAMELGPTERYNAMMMAANLVKTAFGGDYIESVEYMRWAWTREIDNEKKRRARDQETRRMGTRLIFGKYLLADYALARSRKRT